MVFLEVSCVLPAPHTSLTNLKGWNVFVLSGTRKRSRRYYSGQIITTSAEVTLDDCDCKGIAPKCPKHSGLGIILICLDYCNGIHTQKWRWTVDCWCAFSRMILRFKIFIFWGEVSLPIPPTPMYSKFLKHLLFAGKIAGDTRCNMAMASAVINGVITSPISYPLIFGHFWGLPISLQTGDGGPILYSFGIFIIWIYIKGDSRHSL